MCLVGSLIAVQNAYRLADSDEAESFLVPMACKMRIRLKKIAGMLSSSTMNNKNFFCCVRVFGKTMRRKVNAPAPRFKQQIRGG